MHVDGLRIAADVGTDQLGDERRLGRRGAVRVEHVARARIEWVAAACRATPVGIDCLARRNLSLNNCSGAVGPRHGPD